MNNKVIIVSLLAVCFLLKADTAAAELKLPAVLGSNMVLQQGKPITIWGWATPGQSVTITFLNKKYKATANSQSEWKIQLPPAKAGKAGEMIIESRKEKITLTNILIGEVWVCSGQSNMEFDLNSFKDFYDDEIKKSANENIRFATVQNTFSNKENKDAALRVNWTSVNPATVGNSSAVAYFFAKKLYNRLKVPIGLVITAWVGTPAQSWIDENTVKQFNDYDSVYNQSIKKLDLSKLNELREENDKKFRKQVAEQSKAFKQFTAIEFNDSQWKNAALPGNWENSGHPDFDGIAAYRIIFNVSKEDAGKEAVLHLPAIDDIDSTYINGIFLGSQTVWNELRTYKIPPNVLKEGKNCLVIWVEDGQGGGGLNNDAANFFIETSSGKINLKGNAKIKLLVPMASPLPGINLAGIQNSPTVLFNGMIAPLLPLTIRGVIWYQGESNADKYEEYRTLFPALITNWRKRWNQPSLPFLFVQLSSYNPDEKEPAVSNWAFLREAQTYALKHSNTGMAVTIDVGDKYDIHPKEKKEVGERLAAQAFKITYGYKNEIAEGPAIESVSTKTVSIYVKFKNIGSGLVCKGDLIKGFTIAGADKIFYPASARFFNKNHVILTSQDVDKPVYVRYAWANAPMDANVYNKEGFPAEPFRTDK